MQQPNHPEMLCQPDGEVGKRKKVVINSDIKTSHFPNKQTKKKWNKMSINNHFIKYEINYRTRYFVIFVSVSVQIELTSIEAIISNRNYFHLCAQAILNLRME